jgi:Ca2+-binding RTX toxin-like protein
MFSRRQTNGLRGVICAAALLGLLAVASPALASSAFLEPGVTKYDAVAGETNLVEITDSSVDWRGATVIDITDQGTSITPDWGWAHWNGCAFHDEKNPNVNRVWCVVEEGRLAVHLLNQDDRFNMGSLSFDSVRAAVNGGPGNDTLYGGRASDLLFGDADSDALRGDAGADRLSGGTGQDAASYSEKTVPVTVTIPEPAPATTESSEVVGYTDFDGEAALVAAPQAAGDDGANGEHDDVQADIENVTGGAGGDTLIGSSAGNILIGGEGNDDLSGAGGNDTLDTEDGRTAGEDNLDGGPGDDTIFASDGERDGVYCGTGSDRVYADRFDQILQYPGHRCETVIFGQ